MYRVMQIPMHNQQFSYEKCKTIQTEPATLEK